MPRRQHHIAFEDELHRRLLNCGMTRLTESSTYFYCFGSLFIAVQIRLLIVRRHQLRFGVQAPAVGAAELMVGSVDAGRFRHVVFGVNKVPPGRKSGVSNV